LSIVKRLAPVDSRIERQILTGIIVNSTFNQCIWPIWRDDALQFPYSKRIGQWCREYHEKYDQAPGKHIQDIFLNESTSLQPADAEGIKEFLASISDEYEGEFNVDYALDNAEKHFRLAALSNLQEKIKGHLQSGDVETAESAVSQYIRPARPEGKGCNPLSDIDAILHAFQVQESNVLFQFPEALGKLVGPISRGELAAVVGASGIGKTWWMIMVAVNAALRGLNVTFFSYEMPQAQIIRRIQQMITGAPTVGAGGRILVPVWDCSKNQIGDCKNGNRINKVTLWTGKGERPHFDYAPNGYMPCSECRMFNKKAWFPDSWYEVENRDEISEPIMIAKHKALMTSYGNRLGDLHIMAAPSGQMSVKDIKSYLKNREYYDGIITDLVITDSADKMRVDGKYSEHRHGLFSIWTQHKALAEEFHCGVLTASHSNTGRTGKRIKQGDVSEDIRKINESDIAWAINQTPEDKFKGRYLVNMMKIREKEFNPNDSVMVLSALSIGKPYLSSAFEKHFKIKEEK